MHKASGESTTSLVAVRFYRDDDLEQGSHPWRAWRRSVIGASEAPTIMNENPWAKVQRLREEKLGLRPEFTGNAATREGQALEPHARAAASAYLGVDLEPAIAQSALHLFIAASLDGIDATSNTLVEIKCGVKSYAESDTTGRVPRYYWAQLQHQLMVTQLHLLHYVAYRPERPLIVIPVHRDAEYIQRMLEAELRFADTLRSEGHRFQNAPRGTPVH